jgi:hypothetical protein
MTVNLTTARRRPVSHAFVVPVVRELPRSSRTPPPGSATW